MARLYLIQIISPVCGTERLVSALISKDTEAAWMGRSAGEEFLIANDADPSGKSLSPDRDWPQEHPTLRATV
jgi:hypothetical protein